MHAWFAALVAVGAGANPLTEKGGEAIVTAIVRVKNKHNNRLLTLGEFIAVTLQYNPVPRSGHSIYIAALVPLAESSGSVQQLVSLAPPPTVPRKANWSALGGRGIRVISLGLAIT